MESAYQYLIRTSHVLQRFQDDPDRWAGYFGRTLGQLAWWAEAAAQHRERQDPTEVSPAFQRAPDQRNAP